MFFITDGEGVHSNITTAELFMLDISPRSRPVFSNLSAVRRSPKSDSEVGAVLMEFAVVLGVLFLWLVFFVVFARLISQIIWVGQVSYQATIQGMLVPANLRENAVTKVISGLDGAPGTVNLHQATRNQQLTVEEFSFQNDFLYLEKPDIATKQPGDSMWAKINAKTNLSLIGQTTEYMPITFVGPSLTSITNFLDVGDLTDFGNDLDGNLWGCCAGDTQRPIGSCAARLQQVSCY